MRFKNPYIEQNIERTIILETIFQVNLVEENLEDDFCVHFI